MQNANAQAYKLKKVKRGGIIVHDALQDAHNNVALHYASLGGIKFRSQEGLKKTSHFRTLLDVKALISHKENILRRISCRVNFVQTAE